MGETVFEMKAASGARGEGREDARPPDFRTKVHDVRVIRDIEYGVGRVGTTCRPLRLDLYEPVGVPGGDRPALVMAFGGAFHRGSRQNDSVEGGRDANTSVATYCHEFARRGYVACSIDYRLVQDDPEPGDTRVVAEASSIPRSRVDVVRAILGLPPATAEELWRGIEAASDDMAAAFRFVSARSRDWRIDPRRIAVGGFSAGARTALNAAFGEDIDAAAVVSLSGFMARQDLDRLVVRDPSAARRPPVLLLSGENDLDYVQAQHPIMVDHFRGADVPCTSGYVVDANHFYSAEAPTRCDPGGQSKVEQIMADFLAEHVGHNRH